MFAEVLILSLIFILILYGNLYIRIIKTPRLTLKITLGIIALRLNVQRKKLKLGRLFKTLGNTTAILKTSKYLFRKSSVRFISKIKEHKSSIRHAEFSAYNGPVIIDGHQITLPNIYGTDVAFGNKKNEILIKSRLIFLIISLFIFLYYTMIRKIRRIV